jgi:DNA-binding cell septation regulator SpoVG
MLAGIRAASGGRIRAAHAVDFGGKPHPHQPKLRNWIPHRSGTLLGFCSVELASGLVINNILIMSGRNGAWCAMPAQNRVDGDRQPKLDATKKPIYSRIVEFVDRAATDRFNAVVLELVHEAHPGDLADGGAMTTGIVTPLRDSSERVPLPVNHRDRITPPLSRDDIAGALAAVGADQFPPLPLWLGSGACDQ